MNEPYNEKTATLRDRVAWALCQIIDDNAPIHWTRYRGVADCIARNDRLLTDLKLMRIRCPTCESPQPHLHPAMSHGGEVETCADEFHLRDTPENRPDYRALVEQKRKATGLLS